MNYISKSQAKACVRTTWSLLRTTGWAPLRTSESESYERTCKLSFLTHSQGVLPNDALKHTGIDDCSDFFQLLHPGWVATSLISCIGRCSECYSRSNFPLIWLLRVIQLNSDSYTIKFSTWVQQNASYSHSLTCSTNIRKPLCSILETHLALSVIYL